MKKILILLAILSLIPFSNIKATTPLTWIVQTHEASLTVESQPGVINPTNCLWSTDDHVVALALESYLNANTSISHSECIIADDTNRITGLKVIAPAGLVVTISYSPQGITFPLTARPSGKVFEWKGCVLGPRYSDPIYGQIIPNSNGGWGVPSTITVTVSNPTNRRIRNISAIEEIGSDAWSRLNYCQQWPLPPAFSAGGAVWQVGL